jgi:hypothetical protein
MAGKAFACHTAAYPYSLSPRAYRLLQNQTTKHMYLRYLFLEKNVAFALGRNPGRQVARIVIYISADLPPPFSSGRGGPWWRVAPAVSCLASIGDPGSSSIFFG